MEAGMTMPQPVSPKITSTPSVPGQPYDAVDDDDRTPPWVKLEENAGPANINNGRVTGDFADSAPWMQV
jgi:hypothetical protein